MATPRKKATRPADEKVSMAKVISQREIAFAHEMMSGDDTSIDLAAELAGIPKEHANAIWRSPRVRKYCHEFSTLVAKEMAVRASQKLKAVDITPESVISVLYSIANAPINLTRGNATSQVAACETLLRALAALGSIPEQLRGKTPEQMDQFARTGKWETAAPPAQPKKPN